MMAARKPARKLLVSGRACVCACVLKPLRDGRDIVEGGKAGKDGRDSCGGTNVPEKLLQLKDASDCCSRRRS